MDAGLVQALERLGTAHRILAMEGHMDMISGHMSMRDPEQRGVWLKKPGRGIEEILGPEDFVLLNFDGQLLQGQGPSHLEWPIHTELMRARPDVSVVGHTHPYYSVLFSATEQELAALSHEGANLVGKVARFSETAGLINTTALGRSLAGALGQMPLVLMKNHGITFVGSHVEEATINGIFMERACKAQIELAATGFPWTSPLTVENYDRKIGGAQAQAIYSILFEYFVRRIKRLERQA